MSGYGRVGDGSESGSIPLDMAEGAEPALAGQRFTRMQRRCNYIFGVVVVVFFAAILAAIIWAATGPSRGGGDPNGDGPTEEIACRSLHLIGLNVSMDLPATLASLLALDATLSEPERRDLHSFWYEMVQPIDDEPVLGSAPCTVITAWVTVTLTPALKPTLISVCARPCRGTAIMRLATLSCRDTVDARGSLLVGAD